MLRDVIKREKKLLIIPKSQSRSSAAALQQESDTDRKQRRLEKVPLGEFLPGLIRCVYNKNSKSRRSRGMVAARTHGKIYF